MILKYKILLLFVLLGFNISAQHKVPRLVVVVNIEQMRSDYLKRYAKRFENKGFTRLLKEGIVCTNVNMNLHVMKNIVGVPTLFTGVYPDRHGIVNDTWLDRLKGKEVNALYDAQFMTVGGDSREGQRSANLLLSPTIGDVLKIQTQRKAKVFSVALNDYSAIFSSGHAADGAYWIDNQSGNMISSSYYVNNFPTWAFNFNNRKMAENYSSEEWNTLLVPFGYNETSLPDDNQYEKGYLGKYKTFPYNIKQMVNETGNYKILKATPFGNTIVSEFAIALIEGEQLGKDDIPDLLTISYATMDVENNSFTPFSMEMEDIYLRLDKELIYLFEQIDKQVGMDNTLVIVTSACSGTFPAEYLKMEYKMPAGIANPEGMVALLKSFMNLTFGDGEWIEYVSDQQIYLNRALIEKSKLSLETVQGKAAEFVNQFEGIRMSIPSTDILKGDYVKSQLATIAGSFNFKRSGDILYSFEEGWQPQYKYKQVIYNDNASIPMIWMGAGLKGKTNRKPVDAIDMAPTIFEMLGLDIPSYFKGQVIEEILF